MLKLACAVLLVGCVSQAQPQPTTTAATEMHCRIEAVTGSNLMRKVCTPVLVEDTDRESQRREIQRPHADPTMMH